MVQGTRALELCCREKMIVEHRDQALGWPVLETRHWAGVYRDFFMCLAANLCGVVSTQLVRAGWGASSSGHVTLVLDTGTIHCPTTLTGATAPPQHGDHLACTIYRYTATAASLCTEYGIWMVWTHIIHLRGAICRGYFHFRY